MRHGEEQLMLQKTFLAIWHRWSNGASLKLCASMTNIIYVVVPFAWTAVLQ